VSSCSLRSTPPLSICSPNRHHGTAPCSGHPRQQHSRAGQGDLKLIDSMVKRIPVEAVVPLVLLLEKYIKRRQHYNQVLQLRGNLELLIRQAMDRQGDTVVDTDNGFMISEMH